MTDLIQLIATTLRELVRNLRAVLVPLMLALAAASLVMRLATAVGKDHTVTGVIIVSVAVLPSIVAAIIVLQVVSRSLLAQDEAVEGRGRWWRRWRQSENELVDAIAASVLPFLVFYGAWGLFVGEYAQYARTLIFEHGADPGLKASPLRLLGAAAVAFALRALLERRWRATGNGALGLLAAAFESVWMILTAVAAKGALYPLRRWFADLQVSQWLDALLSLPMRGLEALPVVGGFVEATRPWRPDIVEGVLQPIIWLVIGVIVVARDMEHRAGAVTEWRVVGRIQRRVDQAPVLARPLLYMYEELHEKWVPLLIGLRASLTSGALRLLAYFAAYATVLTAAAWLERGLILAVGPRSLEFWVAATEVTSVLGQLVSESLRLVLVGVMTVWVIRHERERVREELAGTAA